MFASTRSALRRIGAPILLTLACAPLALEATGAPSEVTSPTGLRMIDTRVGTGPQPQAGQTVTVNYTGWLYEDGKKGKKFDSSFDRKKPFAFVIGQGNVVKGWDEGVSTMRVGGKRTLIIPPELGYGEEGAGSDIPPNATLIFEVDLLSAK